MTTSKYILWIFLAISTCTINGQRIEFDAETTPHIIAWDATEICSVTNFKHANTDNYWIELNEGRSLLENNNSGNIYSRVYDSNLNPTKYTFNITTIDASTTGALYNQSSLPQTCTNPSTNDIFTSYIVGYYKDPHSSEISTAHSIYYKIFEMNTMTLTNEMMAVNGLKSPYNNSNMNSSWNYNFNADLICNDNWYLMSWYHWDEFETYLQYRIVYKNDTIKKYVSSNIISAYKQTLLLNVSLLISAFGRTKTIMSKSNSALFMSVYNYYNRYIVISKPWAPDNPVEYATQIRGIIGNVYYDTNSNNYGINFHASAVVVNQVTHTPEIGYGYETATQQSGYVLVETTPADIGCCFVIIYGISFFEEVWGSDQLYISVLDDNGEHVLKKDTKIFQMIADDMDAPVPEIGYYGNVQIVELENLRTVFESYFMVIYSVNIPIDSYVYSTMFKIYYDFKKNVYVLDQLNKYTFAHQQHVTHGPQDAVFNALCFHNGVYANQLFVGYTWTNVSYEQSINKERVDQRLTVQIYNVTLH